MIYFLHSVHRETLQSIEAQENKSTKFSGVSIAGIVMGSISLFCAIIWFIFLIFELHSRSSKPDYKPSQRNNNIVNIMAIMALFLLLGSFVCWLIGWSPVNLGLWISATAILLIILTIILIEF